LQLTYYNAIVKSTMTSPDAPVHQPDPTEPVQFEALPPEARFEAALSYMGQNAAGLPYPQRWAAVLHYAGINAKELSDDERRRIGAVLDAPDVQRDHGAYYIPAELADETYKRLGTDKQTVGEYIGRIISADFDAAANHPY